jgi:hypothetical protein
VGALILARFSNNEIGDPNCAPGSAGFQPAQTTRAFQVLVDGKIFELFQELHRLHA